MFILSSSSPAVDLALSHLAIHLVLVEYFYADFDLASVRELDTVRHQVINDDTEPLVIDGNQEILDLVLNFDDIVDLSESDVILEEIEDIVKLLRDVDLLVVWLELILADLGHLQDIVRCEHQLLEADTDHLHIFLSGVIETSDLIRHLFVQLDKGVEGRKEIVGYGVDQNV